MTEQSDTAGLNTELDAAQAAINAYTAKLRQGAENVFNLVTRTSPGIDADELFAVCALASGMFFANAVFPDMPQEGATRAGRLFVAGMVLGREQRMEREIKTCMGAA